VIDVIGWLARQLLGEHIELPAIGVLYFRRAIEDEAGTGKFASAPPPLRAVK